MNLNINSQMNPLKLFNYKRWDVLIKYVYLKYLIKKIGFPINNTVNEKEEYFKKVNDNDFQWFRNLYINHLNILNGGFEEKTFFQDNSKESAEQFLKEFHHLWYDIVINDFNQEHPIPVNAYNQILNGAHRLSIGLILKKDVPIQEHKNITQPALEILPEFFFDRIKYHKNNPNVMIPRRQNNKNNLNKLSRNEMDFLFLEYVKLKNKYLRFLICFQSQIYLENIEKLNYFFNKKGYQVVNISRIALTNYGINNLLNLLYYDEPKVNLVKKRSLSYPNFDLEEKLTHIYYTSIILLEHPKAKFKGLSDSGGSDKMEIRNFLNNYDAIHVTNNIIDTLRVAKLIYNQNSLEIFNYSLPFHQNILLERCLKFEKMLIENKLIDNDNFKIVSSSVLSILGVRKANDLDYLIMEDKRRKIMTKEEKEIYDKINKRSHYSQLKYYPKSLFDGLFHPERYFYLLDFKFQTLYQLDKFKRKRNEIPKDINDYKLIETYFKIKHIIPELKIILCMKIKDNNDNLKSLELVIKNKIDKIYQKYFQLQFFENYLFIELIKNNLDLENIKNKINDIYPNLKIFFLFENQDKWTQRILIHYLQICQYPQDNNRWILFLNDNSNQLGNQEKVFDLVDIWNHLSKHRVPNINYLELVELPNNNTSNTDYLKHFFKNSHHIVDKNHMKGFFWKLIKKYYLELNLKTNLFFQEILEIIYQKDIKALGNYKIYQEWKSFTYFY